MNNTQIICYFVETLVFLFHEKLAPYDFGLMAFAGLSSTS